MTFEQILERLDGARQNGSGWIARCPAHKDRTPSLSIRRAEDGRTLLHCHAGCEAVAITASLGLELHDLFEDGDSNGHSYAPIMAKPKLQPPAIAEEVVEQLHGALFDVTRNYLLKHRAIDGAIVDRYKLGVEERGGEKRVTIPVHDGAEGIIDIRRWLPPEGRIGDNACKMLHWEKGYGGARLFPQDQLTHDTLVFCEGELDALAAISAGVPAITLTAGGSTVPTTEQLQRFAGKQVTMLMDNDEVGHAGAGKRAAALSSHARILKIADWPEARPEGWDITDELRTHGVESLRHILAAAVPYESEELPSDTDTTDDQRSKDSQAIQIYKLIQRTAKLFRDQSNTPFASIEVGEHQEILRFESGHFSGSVRRAYYEEEGRIASTEALNAAIGLAAAYARAEGEVYRLWNRVAHREGKLYYDLADALWRVMEVDGDGWRLLDHTPILFQRHSHQAAQVIPKKGGKLRRLFEFVSVASEKDRLLLEVWLVACFIPDFPHPIPNLHGPQGSGKTSLYRLLRSLIDPSTVPTLTLPRDPGELVQQLSHHYAPMYDNIADLSQWQSDALCRAVTGEGFSKRALYTNDDDFIYQFQRIIGLNGINVVARKPDLLDRAISIALERIGPDERRTESELNGAFEKAKPEIMGGIFDALVNALRIRPSVTLSWLPRMADFAQWGYAIAQGLGYPPHEFIDAYRANIGAQNAEVLADDPVAAAIVELLEGRSEPWQGTATQLLGELDQVAQNLKLDAKAKYWPKAPNALTRRIGVVKANLQDAGIEYHTEHSGKRLITLHGQEASENIVQTVQPSIDVEKQGLKNGRYLDGIEGVDDTEKNIVQMQIVDNEQVIREKLQMDDMDDTACSTLDGERVEELI